MASSGKTLIVDDDDDMRFLLDATINLANRGLVVVGEASSGEAALAIRKALDIDVVVLDQRMPGLNGVETATAMLAESPGLPIVIYSAYLSDALVEQAEQIGVRRCIHKGDTRLLIAALRELTGLDLPEDIAG